MLFATSIPAHLVVLGQLSGRHVLQLSAAQLHRVPVPHRQRQRLAKRSGQRLLLVAGGGAAAAGGLAANHSLQVGGANSAFGWVLHTPLLQAVAFKSGHGKY